MLLRPFVAIAGAGALLCACADDPHTTNTALGGAAIGAVAGAVIGNNVGAHNPASGALIGAAAGGLIGAAKGCADQGGCGARAPEHRQYYDERAARYYYYDSATGRYFWEDGSPR
jgi:phage tail tape-measure protein